VSTLAAAIEHRDTFACFGSVCTVIVTDSVRDADAAAALGTARERLLEWHGRFSRFLADSELTQLNENPRPVVPITPLMRRVLDAARRAAELSGGLVDATLVSEIEEAGYAADLSDPALPLSRALELAPARCPAGPSATEAWRAIEIDRRAGTVSRPPGVKLDPGGIAKGVFADELGSMLSAHDAFVVDCAGDIRVGGRARTLREVHLASPFDESILHTFELTGGGVTTSGIGARSWLGPDGRPAHHLLDPGTGRPAYTGIVQATALAPSTTEAEVRSKAAILSGPRHAHEWLPHGGVIVFDDGSYRILESAGTPG
jgi:thiamine biosynthesis lipoprotein